MKPLLKTTLFYLLPLSLMCTIQCKSTSKNSIDFPIKNIHKGTTSKKIIAKVKIDRGRTYEVYFTIDTLEECLKIEMSSKIHDKIFNKDKIFKSFFIVEKVVDISQFKGLKGKKFAASEIGRNFDYEWNRKREILICTSGIDPIKKLDKAIYRIRFTTFRKKNFAFIIDIYSNNKIFFLEKFSIAE